MTVYFYKEVTMSENMKTLAQIAETLNLKVICGNDQLERMVSGGYASDLLSDVMAHAQKGFLWITLQIHPNIIAVAVLKEITGIIFINGRTPDSETVTKAKTEGIPLLTSPLPAFELAGKLYELGIRGQV
jgi:hypothetical protein